MATVQSYLETLGSLPSTQVTGGSSDTGYTYAPLSSFGDTSKMLSTPSSFYGGQTPAQFLSQYGVTDALNQPNMMLPDPKKGSLFDDLDWMKIVSLPFAVNALATGGLNPFSGVGDFGGGATGAFDMGGSAGVFDSMGNPLYSNVAQGGFGGSALDVGQGLPMGSEGAGSTPFTSSGSMSTPSWMGDQTFWTPTSGGTGGPMDWLKSMFPGGGGAGMPWSPLSSLASIATGLLGYGKAGDLTAAGQAAAAAGDPFGPYRPAAASQLMDLAANPRKIEDVPGYASGLRAAQRALAAQGLNPQAVRGGGAGIVPGKWSYSMDKYGGDFYNQQMQRLMQMAGVQFGPSNSNAILQGAMGGAALQGQALQSMIAGLRGLVGG